MIFALNCKRKLNSIIGNRSLRIDDRSFLSKFEAGENMCLGIDPYMEGIDFQDTKFVFERI